MSLARSCPCLGVDDDGRRFPLEGDQALVEGSPCPCLFEFLLPTVCASRLIGCSPALAIWPGRWCAVPELPSLDAGVTADCLVCRGPLPAGRARLFCSPRCRQAAYRARHSQQTPAPPPVPQGRSRVTTSVYECPGCGERLAGERRCPQCNLFARRIGDGGCCPACGDIVTVNELLDIP